MVLIYGIIFWMAKINCNWPRRLNNFIQPNKLAEQILRQGFLLNLFTITLYTSLSLSHLLISGPIWFERTAPEITLN